MNYPIGTSTYKRLINSCEEMLVLAAQDLAALTKIGIHASDIVALAHTCESLQQFPLEEASESRHKQQYRKLKAHLLNGMYRICKQAAQVSDQSFRRARYRVFIREITLYLQRFSERENPSMFSTSK